MVDEPNLPRLAELDAILDGYCAVNGIKYGSHNSEVENYIGMSRIELCKLSGEECGEISYILQAFAFHLQKEINKEQARVNWADNLINLKAADLAQQYNGYSYEERKKQAISNDDLLRKLEEIRRYAMTRLDRLSYLPARVAKMADSLEQLQYSKRREN